MCHLLLSVICYVCVLLLWTTCAPRYGRGSLASRVSNEYDTLYDTLAVIGLVSCGLAVTR